uniref:telomerase RNA component interacting RNase n=1 Tax=Myxine glutinosa TaxID=7769 RepID=UPI00358FE06E
MAERTSRPRLERRYEFDENNSSSSGGSRSHSHSHSHGHSHSHSHGYSHGSSSRRRTGGGGSSSTSSSSSSSGSRRRSGRSTSSRSSSSSEDGGGNGGVNGAAMGLVNAFANDGSFMELFKQRMAQEAIAADAAAPGVPKEAESTDKTRQPFASLVGRRRGAKLVLKTGVVAKKLRVDEEAAAAQKGDAWAKYMAEVKKYKAHQCGDDDKTHPLVK